MTGLGGSACAGLSIQPKGKPLFEESFQLDMRRTWRKKPFNINITFADRIKLITDKE